jgi:hypothetical protein
MEHHRLNAPSLTLPKLGYSQISDFFTAHPVKKARHPIAPQIQVSKIPITSKSQILAPGPE